MTIRCAICDQPTTNEPSNPWRPFCSERCKMLDLSRWLGGDYVIPGDAADGPVSLPEDPEDPPAGLAEDPDR